MSYIHFILIGYIIVVNLIFRNNTAKDKKLAVILSCIGIILVQCLRGTTVGIDLADYKKGYFTPVAKTTWQQFWFFLDKTPIEKGYVFYEKIISVLFNSNWQLFVCSVAIITNIIFAWFIYKYSKNPLVSYLIFIGLGLYVFSFSALRQILAISFSLVAFDRSYRKKYISCAIWIIIAFLFHKSAFVLIVLPFARFIKIKNKFLPFILAIMLVIIFFAKPIAEFLIKLLMPKYISYLDGDEGVGLLGIFYLLTYFFYYFAIKDKNKFTNYILNLLLLGAISQLFGNVSTLTSRITMYFSVYLMLIVPASEEHSALEDKQFMKWANTLYIIFIFIFLFLPSISSNYLQVGNYQFFWSK